MFPQKIEVQQNIPGVWQFHLHQGPYEIFCGGKVGIQEYLNFNSARSLHHRKQIQNCCMVWLYHCPQNNLQQKKQINIHINSHLLQKFHQCYQFMLWLKSLLHIYLQNLLQRNFRQINCEHNHRLNFAENIQMQFHVKNKQQVTYLKTQEPLQMILKMYKPPMGGVF